MTFAAPLWLALLIPWAALAAWLMRGRRGAQRVPFLDLWRSAVESPKASEMLRPPPIAIVAALLAIAFAVLAASQPRVRTPQPLDDRPVTIIVDRGVTMSSATRLNDVAAQADEAIKQLGVAAVTVINVPDDEHETRVVARNWKSAIAPPTAIDTADALRVRLARSLSRSQGTVLVLSDQGLPSSDPRVIAIAPTAPAENVAVTRFALRDHPTTQAMVTIRNDSSQGRARLTIESAGQILRRDIGLPTRGTEESIFVDLSRVGATARAAVETTDDFEVDNASYLVRQHAWPRVEARGNVPDEVARVVEAYRAARPPSEGAATIAVTSDETTGSNEPMVFVTATVSAAPSNAKLDIREHAITANINWLQVKLASEGEPRRPPLGAEWEPIVSIGGIPLVSVRESPSRQVMVRALSADFARTAEFVILWTNILDWAAGGGAAEAFVSQPVSPFGGEWRPQSGRVNWPGFYELSTGAIRAANAAPLRLIPPPTSDWRPRLASQLSKSPAYLNLLPYLAIASAAGVLVAACTWPRSALTLFSVARTV
jgi:hypothetical protein